MGRVLAGRSRTVIARRARFDITSRNEVVRKPTRASKAGEIATWVSQQETNIGGPLQIPRAIGIRTETQDHSLELRWWTFEISHGDNEGNGVQVEQEKCCRHANSLFFLSPRPGPTYVVKARSAKVPLTCIPETYHCEGANAVRLVGVAEKCCLSTGVRCW
ncbi:hypothetical protein PISMIDRAFT_527522 [Pisolithus microcarpus 441]|uniref:Uncharacterized protein n=1 Tax=Pisolithus microcarpus 441 TaxID=765257 RepID=A0A0C9ZHM7_9AGAM|nr:hypothetical protein PISMIDRAFT_527522 [Pisolithus microcarpus 441]